MEEHQRTHHQISLKRNHGDGQTTGVLRVLCQKKSYFQTKLHESQVFSPQMEFSLISSRQLCFCFLSSSLQIIIKVWLKEITTKFHMPLCITGLTSKLSQGCLSLDKRGLKCSHFKKIIFLSRDITIWYQARQQGLKRTKS